MYMYVNTKSHNRTSLGQPKKNYGSENLVTDIKKMCEILREQKVTAYNTPLTNFELPSNYNDMNSQGIIVLMEVPAATEDIKVSIKALCSNLSATTLSLSPHTRRHS